MPEASPFLESLAVVLATAAVTTLLFQRLRQPVVVGYLVAGMIVGPHIPVPLVANAGVIRALSELGVILLMFSIGLGFSLRHLAALGGPAMLATVAETSVMLALGFLVASALGWSPMERVFAAAMFAIASTTIAAKALDEHGAKGRFVEIVFGVLVAEDLIAILLVAVLTAVAAGGGLSPLQIVLFTARLIAFLAALVGLGALIVPRLIRAVVRLNRAETTLVTTIGVCFTASLLTLKAGYSVALGAFIAGSLVAESGHESVIREAVRPVRDMFVAIFFIAVGMLIDPRALVQHWGAVLAFTMLVIVGKVLAVSVGVFLAGRGLKPAIQAGLSLAHIGEFSFIIAGIGAVAGVTRPFLYAVAVTVSAITALATPWLIRAASPVAHFVDQHLPRPLQTFATLYGSWLERVREAPRTADAAIRRLVGLLLLDTGLLAALIIGFSAVLRRASTVVREWTGFSPRLSLALTLLLALVLTAPLVVGAVRTARKLGLALAVRAMPAVEAGRVDLAAAPRGAMTITLQVAILLAMVSALAAITQPFLPGLPGVILPLLVAGTFTVAFWRSAKNLEGHARAGAEVIASALAGHLAQHREADQLADTMQQVREMLPGLGEPIALSVRGGSPMDGRTLAQLDLRSATGATVLAIIRDGERLLVPDGQATIKAGDVLAVAGSHEALDQVREMSARAAGAGGSPARGSPAVT